MNNTCPSCGAAYAITPDHVGRRMSCSRCNAALVVTADGLEEASPPARGRSAPAPEPAPVVVAPEPEAEDEPARPRRSRKQNEMVEKAKGYLLTLVDPPAWVFAFGTFLVILFLFFPLIDRAKIANRRAAITAGDRKQQRLDREMQTRERPTDAEARKREDDARKRDREAWVKKKSELEESVEDAEKSQQQWPYWYYYGMLFGFLFLMIGSVGLLITGQSAVRRVVGAVVLLALLVGVVGAVAGTGVRLDIGPMRPQ
jgi:hypothetical protein